MTRQLLFALAALCCASGQAYDPTRFYEIKTDYTKLHYLVEKSNVTIPVQVFIDGKSPESEKDYSDAGCEIRSSDNDVVTTSFYTSAMDSEPFVIEPKAKGTATLTIKWGYMTHEMQVMVHEDFSVALYDGETAVDNITLTAGEKKHSPSGKRLTAWRATWAKATSSPFLTDNSIIAPNRAPRK